MRASLRQPVLLVGAGAEQIAAIQAARELGLFVVAVDGNPQAPGLSLADKGLCGDIHNVEWLVRLGKEEHIRGVFSHAVDVPYVVASVAHRLGLPGLVPDVALRATNKLRRYDCLRDHGVPCPKFFLVSSIQEAQSVAQDLGYPVVVKPLDSAGARGVQKVMDPTELEAAFCHALQYSQKSSVLVEEFLHGEEISTESIILDGRIITTGFADRNYRYKERFAPYCIEDGHTIPSNLSVSERRDVIHLVERAIHALDIDWGVAKGDVILTRSGPVVFEMAPRTSGGRFCSDMVPLATGIRILPVLIAMAVGESLAPEVLNPTMNRGAAQRFFFPAPGIIVGLHGVDGIRSLPGIYDVVFRDTMAIGSQVPPVTNHADRIGHVIATGETRVEAVNRAEWAIESVEIETKALPEVEV